MVIAETEELISDHAASLKAMQTPMLALLHHVFWLSNLVVGCLLCGWPDIEATDDLVIAPLIPYTPLAYRDSDVIIKRFWISIGAVQIVWALFRVPALQRPFTTRFALYLGDVSYALYLVHVQAVRSVGRQTFLLANRIFGENRGGHFGRTVAIAFELAPVLFVVFWESDLFMRYVDVPTVRFGKWLERKLSKQNMF
jgi:peptidoglycan/LPS O-acetylase OafA/YrhL